MADNEVVVKNGQRFAVGSDWFDLNDEGVKPSYVDFITEARQVAGVIYLSLGSGIIDANNGGKIDVSARLRMHLGTAQFLHSLLGDMISEALKPTDKSQTN